MRPSYQLSKLYQADLYDKIKQDGNHIVCLAQDRTKSFILLAAIKNKAHQLHKNYGGSITVLVEPNRELAEERHRIITDHTELTILNLFNHVSTSKSDPQQPTNPLEDTPPPPPPPPQPQQELLGNSQVVILSVQELLDRKLISERVNLLIIDHAHLILTQNIEQIRQVVEQSRHLNKCQLLVFMCSLIKSQPIISPNETTHLIRQLESIFHAKVDTSSDIRSLSRMSRVVNMEVLEFKPQQLVTCDWYLLADSMLKEYCKFLLMEFDDKPVIEPEIGFESPDTSSTISILNLKKQLLLVRSCFADLLYAIYCLGFWCSKKVTQIYITEFSRLLSNEKTTGDLIRASATVLNSFYGRIEELMTRSSQNSNNMDIVIHGSSQQLINLLKQLKKAEPPTESVAPLCIIHVRRKVIARVIALWLDKISKNMPEYSFIKPNYITASTRKHRNRLSVDNFDLHHESSMREFRFGNCNTLVTSAFSERSTEIPRCNLVVSFDLPFNFSSFMQAKANCRIDSSRYVIMLNRFLDPNGKELLLNYINMEQLLHSPENKFVSDPKEHWLMEQLNLEYEPYPGPDSKNPATIWTSVSIINKYCSKLPSDSFTKLSPEWTIREIREGDDLLYQCEMRLPINSPVRQTIIGAKAPSRNIAMRLAALTACKILHKSGELSNSMLPITKESMRSSQLVGGIIPTKSKSPSKFRTTCSTKQRQYYKKRIASVFSGPPIGPESTCYLYKFKMVLTCPIPDEQNRRGRRIIDPGETNQNYAIVCPTLIPKICSFPVFTRSGEVLISIELVQKDFTLDSRQIKSLRYFHEFTFSKVLRIEKYPTVFDPDNSSFTVLLAPVIDNYNITTIDWTFVNKITDTSSESLEPNSEDQKNFKFNYSDYQDAVVIPWYRLSDKQQFAYYVAEVCSELTPESPFPDESSGFATFVDYYKSKYNLDINDRTQPILDVDHTSARLNLLTPRYVNRNGKTLPSSTAKTRRESRESLVQKQLLIPELCTIHPFPASFWRKAVCLPCIFYRLNSLFLAEELRREVAMHTKIGFVEPPEDFVWPQLDFGWSLKEVINSRPDNNLNSFHSDDETGYLEESCCYGEWKESKTKNPPLLRELFLPNNLLPYKSEIEALYRCLEDDTKMLIDDDQSLETRKIDEEIDQKLIRVINEVFKEKLIICEDDIEVSLKGWYKLLSDLSNRVDEESDLFKEDELELITVDDSFGGYSAEPQPTFGELLPNRNLESSLSKESWKNIKFDPTRKEINSMGPSPSVILQALTMSNASDGINLERLETVGDSFLKYSITAYLYCMYSEMHEGKLSYLRSIEISNANLYELGCVKHLGELMAATKFEPNDNWLPPGYSVAECLPGDQNNNKKREIDKALAEVPYDLLQQHSIPDKSIADCVEALIGAYLTSSGSRAALLFMQWLGLHVIPPSFDLESDFKLSHNTELGDSLWTWLETPPSPLICSPPSFDEKCLVDKLDEGVYRFKAIYKLDCLYHANNLDMFEKEIGYQFKDKAYIVQAFTHNSYYENDVTDCHQRLEFLGDALLDYLITRYLFEDPQCHSPGTLTDLRSALVNNTFFASLAVKYNFHKYLKYISDELFHVIDTFVKKFKFDDGKTITKGYTLLISEGESEYAEDIEVPKALGDVFESVAGAIYLDSGMSLDQVWRVYFRMMKPEIECFSSNVPKSPIRELLETMPQNVRFSPSELAPDGKHRVIAEVFGLGRFTGVGRSKHSAKSTAAKRALRMLAVKKKELDESPENNQSIDYWC